MAQTDSAVYLPGTGHIYIAPNGTAAPVDPTAPASPWETLGHTSREEGLTITREGGDSEIKGTWQNAALRERRDPTTFAVTMQLHQIDNTVLELYFGDADISVANKFGVPEGGSQTVEKALFVRVVDGANEVGLYVPKVSIGADDDVEVDVENFLAFPVRASVLQVTGSNLLEFFAPNLGA